MNNCEIIDNNILQKKNYVCVYINVKGRFAFIVCRVVEPSFRFVQMGSKF